VLSRVADSIYWMSRYIERAENIARFVDVNLHLMLDLPIQKAEQWEPVVATTGDLALFRERCGAAAAGGGEGDEGAGGKALAIAVATQENVIRFLAFDPEYESSILSCVRAARENARSIREVITADMWEHLNRFYLKVQAARTAGVDPAAFFGEVKQAGQLFAGIADATMSHGEAWHFARLGRELERAEKTSRLLDVKCYTLLSRADPVASTFDNIQWAAVLKSSSALEMYRQRHQRIVPGRVAQFLIFDREFPRSMRHCAIEAEGSLRAITGEAPGTFETAPSRLLGRLRSDLDLADGGEVVASGLHEFLGGFQEELNRLGDAITATFFQ
jgi:uncharacterized alpha-E superfamily protein